MLDGIYKFMIGLMLMLGVGIVAFILGIFKELLISQIIICILCFIGFIFLCYFIGDFFVGSPKIYDSDNYDDII